MSVKRDLLQAAKAKRTNIIQPKYVVGVRVSVENRVDMRDLFPDCLLPEVGRRIYKDAASAILDHHRRTSSAIMWISGRANTAGATDGWHSHGGSTAQDSQCCLHFFIDFGFRSGWRRVHSTLGYGIRQFNPRHAKFEKNVLQQRLLAICEIALGLLLQDRQGIDG